MSTERAEPDDLFAPVTADEPPLTELFGTTTFDNRPWGSTIGWELVGEHLARAAEQPEPEHDNPPDTETVADDACPYPAGWPEPEAQ